MSLPVRPPLRSLRERFPLRRRRTASTGVTLVGDDLTPTLLVASEALAHPAVLWRLDGQSAPEPLPLDDLAPLTLAPDQRAWLDLHGSVPATLPAVTAFTGLPPLPLQALVHPWQRPRFATYEASYFVTLMVPTWQAGRDTVTTTPLTILIHAARLVTAAAAPVVFAAALATRVQQGGDLLAGDASFFLYLVLDEWVADYEDLQARLQARIEALEERALHDPSEDFLEALLRFKRAVYALYQNAEQHRRLFAALLRPEFSPLARPETHEAFADVETRFARLVELLASTREAVNGTFDIYVSHLSHRTNQVIKVLTVASTLLFTVSVIITFFGSTIQTVTQRSSLAFEAMLVILTVAVVTILVLFRRQRWL
jgi:magnesium transporter